MEQPTVVSIDMQVVILYKWSLTETGFTVYMYYECICMCSLSHTSLYTYV